MPGPGAFLVGEEERREVVAVARIRRQDRQ